MHITLIAAVAENRAIGLDNQLIYHIREDQRRFKSLTTGHTVLMGRRTFESLPKGALPNRRNIVVSRTVAHLDGCDTYPLTGGGPAPLRPRGTSLRHRRTDRL